MQPPDPVPQATLVVPDGSAYPEHYVLTEGVWRVSPLKGTFGWEIHLQRGRSEPHDKPWCVAVKPICRMTATIADYETPPPPPPKLQVVK